MPRQDIYRTRCIACGCRFTDANVYSDAGWLETQISGMCETCFDLACNDLIAKEDEQNGNDEGLRGGPHG
jgi:hypothetical protein